MSSKEDALRKHREDLEKAQKTRQSTLNNAKKAAGSEITVTRKYIEALVGQQEWIEHIYPCVVLGIVDKNVAVVEAGFNGGPIKAIFGQLKPKKGRRYELRWPSHQSAFPWIRVPQPKRWLYQKVRGEIELRRWEWPPPGDERAWVSETVAILSESAELIGGMAHSDENDELDSTAILIKEESSNKPGDQVVMEGAPAEPFNPVTSGIPNPYPIAHKAPRCKLIVLPNMGFGEADQLYTLNPKTVSIDAVANDGTTVLGHDITYKLIQVASPSGTGVEFIPITTTTCCMNNWVLNKTFCIQEYNSQPNVVSHPVKQYKHVVFDKARFFRGAGQNLNEEWTSSYTTEKYRSPSQTIDFAYSYVSAGGCHWEPVGGLPQALVWNSESTEIRHAFAQAVPGDDTFLIGYCIFGAPPRQIVDLCSGVWGEDDDEEEPARAWVYITHKATKVFPPATSSNPHPELGSPIPKIEDEHVTVRGFGCQPNIETVLGGTDISPIAVAIDSDKDLIIWGHLFEKSSGLFIGHKWTAKEPGWKKVPASGIIAAVSRDGKDIFSVRISAPINQPASLLGLVFSTDSGETWQTTPTSGFDDVGEGFVFVDEF